MQSKGDSLGVLIPQSLLDALGWGQMNAVRFALARDASVVPRITEPTLDLAGLAKALCY